MEIIKEGQNESIEVFENDIDLYLQLFCENNNIQNMRQESQSVWNSCLRYIYTNVFKNTDILKSKDIRHIDNNSIPSTFNAYNYNTVLYVLDIYIYNLCFKYDKEISIIGFSTLTGIDTDTINEWRYKEPGSLSSVVYKKLHDLREESLSNKLATGNKNPVGILAILNRHYAWNLPGVSRETDSSKKALSVEQLPKLGQIAQNPQIKQIENQDNVVDEQ